MKKTILCCVTSLLFFACSQVKKDSISSGNSIKKEVMNKEINNSLPTIGILIFEGVIMNEVIAPLDKLKNMIGDRQSSAVNVTGEFNLRGQDLVVALQRANRNRDRIL